MNADLESFLKEVTKHVTPKEPTLFAVGGRGYYENPATDLLKFFLKPNAEHKLGNLFLSTYLECMKEDSSRFNMDIGDDKIESQVKTKDDSYIDLQILGPDWCLLIENKIYHVQINPFPTYEVHAKRLRDRTIFSILSPDGHSEANGWKGVSYPDYCNALRQKMPEIDSYNPRSKWQLFAREFILHMENELNDPPMKKEQVADVEKYSNQIAEAEKLARQYREFIREELKRRLETVVSGQVYTSLDSWPSFWLVCRCATSQWGTSDLVLCKPEGAGQKFLILAYLENMSEQQLSRTRCELMHMTDTIEGKYTRWTSHTGYDTREEAISELCKLAQIVSDLLKK